MKEQETHEEKSRSISVTQIIVVWLFMALLSYRYYVRRQRAMAERRASTVAAEQLLERLQKRHSQPPRVTRRPLARPSKPVVPLEHSSQQSTKATPYLVEKPDGVIPPRSAWKSQRRTVAGIEFASLPPGAIVDSTSRKTTFLRPLWVGTHEITQQQWQTVFKENPARHVGADLPVESVTFEQVARFCRRLSEQCPYTIRLPTLAEWEYACLVGKSCRGGGAVLSQAALDERAWYRRNSDGKSHPVGTKAGDAFGIHDLLGNVSEYAGARDFKGGCYLSPAKSCTARYTGGRSARHIRAYASPFLGFRVVCVDDE